MGQYSRLEPSEAEGADLVHALVLRHPEGITAGRLMRNYKDRLKDYRSILAAAELLADEGKVRVEKSGGHEDVLDVTKIYPL
jgi:hypothetical protein